jgi:hypothetical protein
MRKRKLKQGEAWICNCGWIIPSTFLRCSGCDDVARCKRGHKGIPVESYIRNVEPEQIFYSQYDSSFSELWLKDFDELKGYLNVKEALCYKAYCELSTGE